MIFKQRLRTAPLQIQYPIQLKKMTDEETRDYHLKRLEQLSIKSLGVILQLDEPTYDQKEWVLKTKAGV